jgi:hypothetical protein
MVLGERIEIGGQHSLRGPAECHALIWGNPRGMYEHVFEYPLLALYNGLGAIM